MGQGHLRPDDGQYRHGHHLADEKCADAHGLTVDGKAAEYILGTNGTVVKIVGMTSMTLLLASTLELDVVNVAICLGDFY